MVMEEDKEPEGRKGRREGTSGREEEGGGEWLEGKQGGRKGRHKPKEQ